MKLKHLNWLYKLLGYTTCYKCKKIFKRKANTSVGAMWSKEEKKHISYVLCDKCTSDFLKLVFGKKKYKNPFKKFMEIK